MKNIFTHVLGVAVVVAVASLAANAQTFTGSGTYNGNGVNGFSGAVGNSALTLSYSAGTVSGSLAAGAPFGNNNALVLYIGTGATGITDTSSLSDTADPGRSAISGLRLNNVDAGGVTTRTIASFAAGFTPSYAISLEPGVFGGLFNLSTPSNLGFVSSVNLAGDGTGTGPFTFSFPVSALGLLPENSNNIDFVGTLISTTAFRSNETIGTSTTVAGGTGGAPNGGFTGTQTFSTFNRLITTAPVVVPEANTVALALLALPVLGAVAARRRK